MKKEPFTEEELLKIHAAIGKITYADYVYAHCLLGIRPGEFVALETTDVRTEGEQMFITVRSRTGARPDRSVPVPPQIREIIERRLMQRVEVLFPRADIRRGVWLGFRPMTRDWYMKRVFKPMLAGLGIDEEKTAW